MDKEMVHQMSHVLRLQVGDELILSDGDGREALGAVVHIDKRALTISLQERPHQTPEPKRSVTLYAAVLRRETFEILVQKAVECGATRIVPLITKRTVKRGLKMDRVRAIAKEAAEQCGRGRVPEVAEPLTFDTAVASMGETQVHYFCEIGAGPIADINVPADRIGIFIGPEGGWDDAEIALAEQHDMTTVGLGDLVLRAETAATIATYLLCHSL